jgi:hypothetical protein
MHKDETIIATSDGPWPDERISTKIADIFVLLFAYANLLRFLGC